MQLQQLVRIDWRRVVSRPANPRTVTASGEFLGGFVKDGLHDARKTGLQQFRLLLDRGLLTLLGLTFGCGFLASAILEFVENRIDVHGG